MQSDVDYTKRAGALLRAVANDLKRDDHTAANDLGLSVEDFHRLTVGEADVPPEFLWRIARRAARVWPINERDLLPIFDDCPSGVLIMTAEQSATTARVLSRDGRPYYEYRDTAMSRVAMFRPEWIRMLQVVENDNPSNPLASWNNGHLLYQFTYFVGEVNYYYEWQGKRHCMMMSTGDSVWSFPFVPHTFTARRANRPAQILALTYGAELLGDAQQELSVLGHEAATHMAVPVHNQATASGKLLRLHIRAAGMTASLVAAETGIPASRLWAMVAGRHVPEGEELRLLARALKISVRDLLPPSLECEQGLVVARRKQTSHWLYPSKDQPHYMIRALAGSTLHPFTRGMEVRPLLAPGGRPAFFRIHQHLYVYNLGSKASEIVWWNDGERRIAKLHPGDSAYIKPFVPHGFRSSIARRGAGQGRLLTLRIAGKVGLNVMFALGAMPASGRDRSAREDRQWY
jgi:methylphosphonate synthase